MGKDRKLVVVVEDNPKLALRIRDLVKIAYKKTDVVILGNVLEAYKLICRRNVSLLITDIETPGQKNKERPGIRLIKQLRKNTMHLYLPIIVLNASERNRLYAFRDWHCVGFFQKPLDEIKFLELARRILHAEVVDEQDHYFVAKRHNVRYLVKVRDLMYVSFFKRALHLYINNGDVFEIVQKPLKMIVKEAKAKCLVRCGRNTLVNTNYIEEIDFKNRVIYLKDGTRLKLGDTYSAKMKEIWKPIDEIIRENEERLQGQ